MYDHAPRMIGHIAHHHERRGPRVVLAWTMGFVMGVGGLALYGATVRPVAVDPAPDAALCRARLDTWLYGGDWVRTQEPKQWQHFRTHMGDCLKTKEDMR